MAADFRSDRLSPEGRGNALRAWAACTEAVKVPERSPSASIVGPAIEKIARDRIADLIGFWVIWHLYGGFEGLERFGMHKSTIWRKVARFRQMTGQHPDEFKMPGIEDPPRPSTGRRLGHQGGEAPPHFVDLLFLTCV